MRNRQKTKKALAVAVGLIAIVGGLEIRPSQAGDETPPSPATSTAVSIPTAIAPDVQIVVSPDPTGQWVVAAVYPNKTDQKKAEARAREMLTLAQWKGSGLLFENKGLDRVEESKDAAPLPMMSSVTVTTPGNIVHYANGTIPLEPFIRAYHDLNRLNILFLVPGTFKYRGPHSYRDDDIEMTYASGGSAFTYVVLVKNHGLKTLHLPQFEAAVASATPVVRVAKLGPNKAVKMATVIGLALLAAGLAFFGVQRWNTR